MKSPIFDYFVTCKCLFNTFEPDLGLTHNYLFPIPSSYWRYNNILKDLQKPSNFHVKMPIFPLKIEKIYSIIYPDFQITLFSK